MNYSDLIIDSNIKGDKKTKLLVFIHNVIESGGLIYGGFIRDLLSKMLPHDIDIFYKQDSKLGIKVLNNNGKLFNSRGVQEFTNLFSEYFSQVEWLDEPLDDYGDLHIETMVQMKNLFHKGNCFINLVATEIPGQNNSIVFLSHASKSTERNLDVLPTAKKDFLDFDINSLYIDLDGKIKSTLGNDKLNKIINKCINMKCTLMRSDLALDRIEHIEKKGFECETLAFL